MVSRTPRACRHPHCPGLTIDRSGYCDKHRNTGWENHQGGRTRHQRGYGSEWDKLRRRILKRDKHLCQECLRGGRAVPACDVDHITAKKHGGLDEDSNLESLCRTCHRAKTARERLKQPQ
ncbi:HNH endonuclease [Vibrio parahaemolyticus]|uniref:HNH endonuclease n=1 Tax=Vibrio parahaemolyticus TaxID=670 RepID=UPI00215D5C3C|nr:HNH endonuclease [Vibrio parahaemolyticus]MCR9330126.1 HNH endonuclease [Vibrio parahaemolyticus]